MNIHDIDIELPPLPKGDIAADTCPVMWVHTDQQLQDYAREAIEHDRKRNDNWRHAVMCAISHNDYETDAPRRVQQALRLLSDAFHGLPFRESIIDDLIADRQRRGEPVYAYRRKGFDRFVTCSEDRYEEMRELDHAFDVRVFYAAPQITEPVKVNAIFETENGEVIGTTDANVKRVEWQDDGSLTVVIDYWPQPAAPKFGGGEE